MKSWDSDGQTVTVEADGPLVEVALDPVDAHLVDDLVNDIAALLDGKFKGRWAISLDGKTGPFSWEFDDL